MHTELVSEGRVRLEVPELKRFRTSAGDYAPSLTRVFYNPRMELCRDISVGVAQVSVGMLGDLRVCDPLAGVGVRGIRYAKEVSGISRVVVNDRLPEAHRLILRNIELNRADTRVKPFQKDANVLLWENRGKFNFIDIDPFGSPAAFLNAACAAMSRRGVLSLTATDTAPLCGSGARACFRRYGARPLRTVYCRELGIRILIGFAQRVGGMHGMALKPVLSHATQHYFRVYLWAERGARKTDEILKGLGHVLHCFECGRRSFAWGLAPELDTCVCQRKPSRAGPLWLGPLSDPGFAREVLRDLSRRGFRLGHLEASLLNLCAEEAEGRPAFYEINELAKLAKTSPPKLKLLMERLKNSGHSASRTHFSPTGFRTYMPFERIIEYLKSI